MLSKETIREAVERIVTAARPSKVIVFGSHGAGHRTKARIWTFWSSSRSSSIDTRR